ncbi:transmembrane protein, putative [Medicago truncatula]|uniref:Transmembrane protein, putative n=1 Tax=Medicago truncatula TaxID=3880 RepID=G7J819_MEDTR|nr:transmembrane protein, putative [Medicago truncatula]
MKSVKMTRIRTIAKYDYVHQAQNLLHYGHQTPPTYDISELPLSLVVLLKDNYAHVDFIAAVNAKQVVYDPMILQLLLCFKYIYYLSINNIGLVNPCTQLVVIMFK